MNWREAMMHPLYNEVEEIITEACFKARDDIPNAIDDATSHIIMIISEQEETWHCDCDDY